MGARFRTGSANSSSPAAPAAAAPTAPLHEEEELSADSCFAIAGLSGISGEEETADVGEQSDMTMSGMEEKATGGGADSCKPDLI